tara:strand:- start:811 stop:1959 length:1149 start_codon:yes stop_codon:yes gene_type:complete
LLSNDEAKTVHVVDVSSGVVFEELTFPFVTAQFAQLRGAAFVGNEIWAYSSNEIQRFHRVTGSLLGSTNLGLQGIRTVVAKPSGAWVLSSVPPGIHEVDTAGNVLQSVPINAEDVLRVGNELLISRANIDVIERYDLNFNLIGPFGAVPPGSFTTLVSSLALRANGNVLASGGLKLHEFGPTGQYLAEIEAGGFEQDMIEMADGRILSANAVGLGIYDPDQDSLFSNIPGTLNVAYTDVAPYAPSTPNVRTYCAGAPTSTGSPSILSAFGSRSASSSALLIDVIRAPANEFGMFLMGTPSVPLPVGDGLLCVSLAAPGFLRLGSISQVGQDGRTSMTLDTTSLPATHAIQAGSTFGFQFVHRDPVGGPAGFTVSSALAITFE